MRRFALVCPACALVFLFLTTPASAQYPKKNPVRNVDTPGGELTRLQSKAPGHNAIVTMNDGTLRGGWVASVNDTHLNLEEQRQSVPLALSDIAVVRVQRPDRTLWYAMFGYIATATAATIIAYNDDNHEFKDLAIVFGVAGIPGGLIGAAFGHRCSGDLEIVP